MIVPTSTYLAHRTEHYRTEHYRVHVTVNTTVVQWGRDLSQTNFVGGSVRGNYWRAKLGDTDTVRILKVLIHMKRFAEKDTSRLLLLVLILNVFDKGFRNVVDAREQGQRCLQPCFARSDAQFTSFIAHVLQLSDQGTNEPCGCASCQDSSRIDIQEPCGMWTSSAISGFAGPSKPTLCTIDSCKPHLNSIIILLVY